MEKSEGKSRGKSREKGESSDGASGKSSVNFRRLAVFGPHSQTAPSGKQFEDRDEGQDRVYQSPRDVLAEHGVSEEALREIDDSPYETHMDVLERAMKYASEIESSLRTALNLMFSPIRRARRRRHYHHEPILEAHLEDRERELMRAAREQKT